MKKVVNMSVAALIIVFAITLIVVSFTPRLGLLSEAKKASNVSDPKADEKASPAIELYSSDVGQFFSSVSEYLDYLGIDSTEDADYDTSQIYHWAEEDVMDDASLINVFVSEEGTVFNYYLERDCDAALLASPKDTVTNIIDIYPGYDLIDGLLHALIQKDYSLDAINIIDTEEFAENLAADLGCEEDLIMNYATRYVGEVYVRDHTGGTFPQVYLVGYQVLVYTYVPDQPEHVVYSYIPVSLSETERSEFLSTMEYYLGTNNTID